MKVYNKDGNEIELQEVKKEINIGTYFIVRKNSPTTIESFYPIEFKNTETVERRCELYIDNVQGVFDVQFKIENNSLHIKASDIDIGKVDSIGTLVISEPVILR